MDPDERAQQAAAAADVAVRRLDTLDEARTAVDISRATWGDDNLVPPEAFRAIQESGNPLLGAFRDEQMIGFAIGWFGRDDEGWHLHSHQLAVLPDRRSKGIGYALKLAQRADVLASGVTRIRWTFDPLQARNAYLNLTKLGAVADAFHRDFYGAMPDTLNAGDRSDRLVVRWDIEGEPPSATDQPTENDPLKAIPIPEDFASMKAVRPDEAAEWRDDTAAALEAVFASGQEIVGFVRDLGYLVGTKGAL